MTETKLSCHSSVIILFWRSVPCVVFGSVPALNSDKLVGADPGMAAKLNYAHGLGLGSVDGV